MKKVTIYIMMTFLFSAEYYVSNNGDLNNPIEITADMFSQSAIEKLEKAGGKAIYK